VNRIGFILNINMRMVLNLRQEYQAMKWFGCGVKKGTRSTTIEINHCHRHRKDGAYGAKFKTLLHVLRVSKVVLLPFLSVLFACLSCCLHNTQINFVFAAKSSLVGYPYRPFTLYRDSKRNILDRNKYIEPNERVSVT
jgi:hypothetical protein